MYILCDGYQCMVTLKPCIFQCLVNFKMDTLLFKGQCINFADWHFHVQSNKCIKGVGVVVGLKEDWSSCSLELKFGRARNCSSAVINLPDLLWMMEKQIPGTINKLYIHLYIALQLFILYFYDVMHLTPQPNKIEFTMSSYIIPQCLACIIDSPLLSKNGLCSS